MLEIVFHILRLLALVAGSIFIYFALFLYENEQGKIQNVLENLWVRINDYNKTLLSKQTVFMREVARFTENSFRKLFGERLFSLRPAAVSACFSFASLFFILSYKIYSNDSAVKAL